MIPATHHPFAYLNWIVQARTMVQTAVIEDNEDFKRSFEIISANLDLLLPHIPQQDQLALARMVKFNQMWAAHDQDVVELPALTQVMDPYMTLAAAAQGAPHIFVTFHVGSYRLLGSMLGIRGIPFSLLTDRHFIENQGPKVKQAFASVLQYHQCADSPELEIIDAENEKAGLQLLRRIKAGRSLVIYQDGNTGTGGFFQDTDKLVAVPFLGQRLHARKGAAFLSHLNHVPIVPVFSNRVDWLGRETIFGTPILPEPDEPRDAYCQRAITALFQQLEERLRQDPAQWEGWFYIHKFLDLDQPSEHAPPTTVPPAAIPSRQHYQHDAIHFPIITLFGDRVLFDKRQFKVIPLTERLESLLEYYQSPSLLEAATIGTTYYTVEAIHELVQLGILAPADGG